MFKAGKYEDGVDRNSTFDEGDWNGDGEFDSSDLLLAFKAGTYLRSSFVVDSLFTDLDDERRSRLRIFEADALQAVAIALDVPKRNLQS